MRHRLVLALGLAALVLGCRPPRATDTDYGVPVETNRVIVDQFGWRTADRKVAILAKPVSGFNSGFAYTLPAAGAPFEVRRSGNDSVAFSGTVTRWNNGATHAQSGDQACWADFTLFAPVADPGPYYVYDPSNNMRSYDFEIRDDLYNDILRTAGRAFYYQRCGTAIDSGHGENWTHTICHTSDVTAHRYNTTSGDQGPTTEKDVSGGWHDAGDYNKYVPFTLETVCHLLLGYEINPTAYGDNWGIPESGNGVPDILDEIRYELDWLRKMQNADGSVCNRVGVLSYDGGYPQEDTQTRYYTQATSWATSTMAGLCAHGARLFAAHDAAYAITLQTAAEDAWDWLEANTSLTPASGNDGGGFSANGFAAALADSNAGDDARRRLFAAAELYKTTNDAAYDDYFVDHYDDSVLTEGGHHPIGNAFDPGTSWITQLAMIVYASAAGADATAAGAIKTSLQNGIEWHVRSNFNNPSADPYRAFIWDGHYCWGSNQLKMHWAFLPLMGVYLNINSGSHPLYKEIAGEYIHYIHGRNPISIEYLTNMGTQGADLGADNPVMEAYHGWFHDGSTDYDGASSTYGQAPGFLAGGANSQFTVLDIIPPAGQPRQKSFKDWNTAWNTAQGRNENSWEVTEPAIYYQAKYLSVLGYFCSTP